MDFITFPTLIQIKNCGVGDGVNIIDRVNTYSLVYYI